MFGLGVGGSYLLFLHFHFSAFLFCFWLLVGNFSSFSGLIGINNGWSTLIHLLLRFSAGNVRFEYDMVKI